MQYGLSGILKKFLIQVPVEPSQAEAHVSEEKTLDLSDFLRDCPDDFLFTDLEETEADSWDHEERFVREPPTS